jgi:acyl-homoserine lactone acylase PvdQ
VQDSELVKAGLFDSSQLYEVPDELIYQRSEKKEKVEFQTTTEMPGEFKYGLQMNGQGSNCWAVHGNHTKSGKPLLACDPHLQKAMHTVWYMSRLRWNITSDEGEEIRTYLSGF